jgi:flagellar FliL protein
MAEEKDVNEREQPTKKSKFKLILFGIIILVLVIAGFLAYLFFFSNKSATQTGNVMSPEVQTTPSSKDPSNIGPLYSFDTFIVNLADPGGTRYLKVSMQAEVDSNKVIEEIEKRKPQVRDLVLTVLSSKTYAEVSTPQGKIALKQEIIRRLNLILTTGTVRNIYFTEFVSQ